MRLNRLDIPVRFDLLGYEWSVEVDAALLPREQNCRGLCEMNMKRIRLAPASQIGQRQFEQTFLHEVVHAILDAMGQETLNGDEAWVDAFSAHLHQILTTATQIKLDKAPSYDP